MNTERLKHFGLCVRGLLSSYRWTRTMTKSDWSMLLIAEPWHAIHCPYWNEFSGQCILTILSDQPRLYRWVKTWDNLSSDEWVTLLMRHPVFAKYCDWDKLDEDYPGFEDEDDILNLGDDDGFGSSFFGDDDDFDEDFEDDDED